MLLIIIFRAWVLQLHWILSIQLLLKFICKFYRVEDKGTTATVQEVKDETKTSRKKRTKHQKAKAKRNQAKESGSKATVDTADGSAKADTDIIIDAATLGDCLFCGELTKKICAKCQMTSNQISYHCSIECWDEHLPVHMQICSLDKPQKKYPNSSQCTPVFFIYVYPKNEGIGCEL